MSLTLDIGATGMLAQQLNVDVISNNIANMTTTGYKRQRAEFQDLLYQTKVRPGASSSDQGTTVPAGIQQGLGVKAGSVYRINEQGALQMTGNPFDIAIKGEGYYMITLPSGETGYTRDGSFQLDQDGQLVTSEGYDVQPGITIPPDAVDVTVNASGEVLVKLQNQTALTNVGQIQLATFANDAGLEAIGNNILMETEASGTAVVSNPGEPGYGQLEQGALETSNVNIVQEITSLIQAQRAYEMNSKIIQTGDEMLSTISNLR
ncbi:MAG TPA: flagellar basal-body rod protein FlgG [Alphaproteobacteria bacterium]|nr:flagellar basal-body rod protein FlgG [Alphaproteobacteria bacterium]HRJ67898.1 flagellar basal-body rod protein FlgG [Alphaproteobacteria bacterium]